MDLRIQCLAFQPIPLPGDNFIRTENATYKKKSLGQNFLTDYLVAEQIVTFAKIGPNSSIVEIGPGSGNLTRWIYESKPKRGILVELDNRFIQDLKINFPDFQIINEDVCELYLSKLVSDPTERFIIMGNLPYNMSTKILEHLINYRDVVSDMILMFQKEVGDRIYAKLRTKDYGRLTLLSQEFFETENLLTIGPQSFDPSPKVDSVVVRFSRRATPLIELEDRKIYDRIIKMVFSNRRKMIRRSLRALYDEATLSKLFEQTGVVPTKRPEELTIQDFALLSNTSHKLSTKI